MNKSSSSSSKTTSKIPPKQLEIGNQNHVSTPKSRCSVSRCVCIQLLVLLCLLVLAAIIIPIIVIVLDTRTNSCATTYSDSFTNGATPTTQCTNWRIFTTGLTCTSYSKMRIYGSNDPKGITITDTTVVTALAIGLRYNTSSIIAPLNGINWRAGSECWGGYHIGSAAYCSCPTGYSIRPCVGNAYWGGINGATCNAPSQTLSIDFE
ncbi:hypothetical protein I4U23_011603 [Adineta vaga]|nr:hypothetical protein I4U23_011603 [Adineta vaga]